MAAYLVFFALFLGLVPLSLFILYRNESGPETRYILPFVVLIAVASIYELVFSILLQINVLLWFKIYSLLEFYTLYYLFYRLHNGKYRTIFYFFALTVCLFYLFLLFVPHDWKVLEADSYMALIDTFFVYFFAILWFRNIFVQLEIDSLWNQSAFYFISGLLLYFAGTFFLFLLSDIMYLSDQIIVGNYWIINIMLTILLRILITIGIWKAKRK